MPVELSEQTIITDTEALSALCSRLSRAPFVTVDTEFMRESTFWAKLCLIQVVEQRRVTGVGPADERHNARLHFPSDSPPGATG